MLPRPLLRVVRFDLAKTTAPPIHIFEQLRLEEALYRADSHNWLLINDGGLARPQPSVVLGISGKPHQMCHAARVKQERVPLYRRFTGGGTVVVGKGTTFVSFIGNKTSLPEQCTKGPRELMKWSGEWYSAALHRCGVDVNAANSKRHTFALRENDYVLGNRKFAGNAQGLSRERFVHHTSILWNFKTEDMNLLQNPDKQPEYRQHRDHHEFLIPLSETMKDQQALPEALIQEMADGHGFDIENIDVEENHGMFVDLLSQKHHKSSSSVNMDNVKLEGYPYVDQRW
tara:strand:+ start:399 stop:1256 length:858 start_codon:yes stop_codon:yes gene_type:complete